MRHQGTGNVNTAGASEEPEEEEELLEPEEGPLGEDVDENGESPDEVEELEELEEVADVEVAGGLLRVIEGEGEEAGLEDSEVGLDELLRQQWGGVALFGPDGTEEEAEEEEVPGRRRRMVAVAGVPGRRPDEFVCRSCFLVKHLRLLADRERQICEDCSP